MPREALFLALLLTTTAFAGCIGDDGPAGMLEEQASAPLDPDALVSFTKIHSPAEITELVEGYDELPGVSTSTIGASLEGRPLHLVTVGQGPFEIWIVGRQHGDEPTGGEAILQAIEILAHPDKAPAPDAPPIVHAMHEHRETLLERITFLFVPVGNPDGAAAYQRETATGVDPNRDHFLFTQPATQALREAFWAHRPDGCLDLHNEGIGDTDFDAFGPVGPLLEEETEALMLRDGWIGVREVDAAGGRAGAMNENYRAPPPADDQVNPTAYHPGTHDLFCTTRGAPGWTPEGAISGGSNGATDHMFAWSTRLHLTTVAASAFHWAGAYDAAEPTVRKAHGSLSQVGEARETVELEDTADARFQVVWRQTETGGDHNPFPNTVTVTTPTGHELEARQPGPERWTATVSLDDATPGTYTVDVTGAPQTPYEVRTYLEPPSQPLAQVERDGSTLVVNATEAGLDTEVIHLTLTDVMDPAEIGPGTFSHGPEAVHQLEGTVDQRTLVTWELVLEPGETIRVETDEGLEHRGPLRFTATTGDLLQTGIESARNPGEPT